MAGELWKTALGAFVGGAANQYARQQMWGQMGRGQNRSTITMKQLYDIVNSDKPIVALEGLTELYPILTDKQQTYARDALEKMRHRPEIQNYYQQPGRTMPSLPAREPGLWEQVTQGVGETWEDVTQGASAVGETMGEMFGLTEPPDPQGDVQIQQRPQERAANEQQMVAMNAQGQFLQQKRGMLQNLAILEQVVSGAPDDGIKKTRMADWLQQNGIPPKVLKGYKPDQYPTIVQGLRRTINAAQTPEAIQGALTQFRTGDPLSQGKAVDDLFHRGGQATKTPSAWGQEMQADYQGMRDWERDSPDAQYGRGEISAETWRERKKDWEDIRPEGYRVEDAEQPGEAVPEPVSTPEEDKPTASALTPAQQEQYAVELKALDDQVQQIQQQMHTMEVDFTVNEATSTDLENKRKVLGNTHARRTMMYLRSQGKDRDPVEFVMEGLFPQDPRYWSLAMTETGRKVLKTFTETLKADSVWPTRRADDVLRIMQIEHGKAGLPLSTETKKRILALGDENGMIPGVLAKRLLDQDNEYIKQTRTEGGRDARAQAKNATRMAIMEARNQALVEKSVRDMTDYERKLKLQTAAKQDILSFRWNNVKKRDTARFAHELEKLGISNEAKMAARGWTKKEEVTFKNIQALKNLTAEEAIALTTLLMKEGFMRPTTVAKTLSEMAKQPADEAATILLQALQNADRTALPPMNWMQDVQDIMSWASVGPTAEARRGARLERLESHLASMMAWKDVDPKSVPPWQERHVRGLIDKFKEMGGESRTAALGDASMEVGLQYANLDTFRAGDLQRIIADVASKPQYRDYHFTVKELGDAARLAIEKTDVSKQGKRVQKQKRATEQVMHLTDNFMQAIYKDDSLASPVKQLTSNAIGLLTNLAIGKDMTIGALKAGVLSLAGWEESEPGDTRNLTAKQAQQRFLEEYSGFWDISGANRIKAMEGLLVYRVARMLDDNGRLSDQDIENAKEIVGSVSNWWLGPSALVARLQQIRYEAEYQLWRLEGGKGDPPRAFSVPPTNAGELRQDEEDAFQSLGTP